jgi:serine/threonine-protein kinase RsbW
MQIVINSDTLKLKEVEGFVDEAFTLYKLPREFFHNILLCVKEAVTNSIIHGNNSDVNKKVTVKITRCHDNIVIKVSDEGAGFDFEKVKDPTNYDNIKEESGRGIFLIRKLCDELEFKGNGKIIEFKIALDGE